jgi:hypothetical protein
MQRALGTLTMLAAGLLLLAMLMSGGGVETGGAFAQALAGFAGSLDKPSFAAGVAAGIIGQTLYRVPWAEFPRRMMTAVLGWRRGFVMTALAIAFTGVLLFY